MHINFIAVLAAAVASFIFGGVWYNLLSKPWLAALGWTEADTCGPDGKKKMPAGPMIVGIIGQLIMAGGIDAVSTHIHGGPPTVFAGALTGAAIWFHFVVTTMAINYAFQKRKVMLNVIDGAHWLGVLLIQGLVIGLLA